MIMSKEELSKAMRKTKREIVLKNLHKLLLEVKGYLEYEDCIDYAIDELERKGHWIEHPHEWGDNWQYSQYECSCCHNWAHFDTDYCPNCGTEMEEVKV